MVHTEEPQPPSLRGRVCDGLGRPTESASPPAATEPLREPGRGLRPVPAVRRGSGRAGTPRSTSPDRRSHSLCPSAPGLWPREPGGLHPMAGCSWGDRDGEPACTSPGCPPRRAPLFFRKPSEREPLRSGGMSTDPARSPDRGARAGEKESKGSAQP